MVPQRLQANAFHGQIVQFEIPCSELIKENLLNGILLILELQKCHIISDCQIIS